MNLEVDDDVVDPKLGDTIPQCWHSRLDQSSSNIFQPQEWVGYEVQDGVIKFAQVVHPVELRDSSGQPLKPIHIKYVIFTSEDSDEEKEVSALDLYKFIRGKQALKPANPDCQDLVSLVEPSGPESCHFTLSQAEEARESAKGILSKTKTILDM